MGPFVASLSRSANISRDLLGGKGESLCRLRAAGVPVPAGFVVTTVAYAAFARTRGLNDIVAASLAGCDYRDIADLDDRCARIRDFITDPGSPMSPDIRAAIATAHEDDINADSYVAVRSSGVAEDMPGSSFAGLYDTFLNVVGIAEVVEAVRRCWASLWTTRCVSYRNERDISSEDSLIAVVVQTMVEADVAGVLFTANPLNGDTHEMVVNAAWGLGEGVASGITTPDEFVLDRRTHRTKRRTVGGKELRVVRAPGGASGTIVEPVPREEQSVYCLSEKQLRLLGDSAERIVALASDVPQDVEWAMVADELFILQSRDITGVTLAQEDNLESWRHSPEPDRSTWTHLWTRQFWSGGVTPLFYTLRARELAASDERLFSVMGIAELARIPRFKYSQATVLYNCEVERGFYEYVLPSRLRRHRLENLPPSWHAEVIAAPFSMRRAALMHARIRFLTKDQGPFRSIAACYDFMRTNEVKAAGVGKDALETMPDADLQKEVVGQSKMFEDWFTICRPPFHIYGAFAFSALTELLGSSYNDVRAGLSGPYQRLAWHYSTA